jgi:predicted AAA+ superfamily ATPase
MSENREFFEKVGTQVPDRKSGLERALPQPTQPSVDAGQMGQVQQAGSAGAGGQRRWAANDSVFWAASETHDGLPPGLYRCGATPNLGYVLHRQRIETDDLLALPDDATTSIISEFRQFWQLRAAFQERGFLHKRGFLLWGPPGSGKTTALQLLVQELIDAHEGVVVFIDEPATAAGCLQMVRRVESDRPLICLMEDLDALVQRYGENEYLALLDGEAQIANVCFVATSNYPECLDKRFVDRPSRFDTVKRIDMPGVAARRLYLGTKEPSLTGAELEHWVKISEGLSVAHLKEMIIANRCFGQPIEVVIERLTEMHERQPTSDDLDRRPVGFAIGAVR